jgi:hypothetical protein
MSLCIVLMIVYYKLSKVVNYWVTNPESGALPSQRMTSRETKEVKHWMKIEARAARGEGRKRLHEERIWEAKPPSSDTSRQARSSSAFVFPTYLCSPSLPQPATSVNRPPRHHHPPQCALKTLVCGVCRLVNGVHHHLYYLSCGGSAEAAEVFLGWGNAALLSKNSYAKSPPPPI